MNPRPAIKHDGIPAHWPHYIGDVPVRLVNGHLYDSPQENGPTESCAMCRVLSRCMYGDRCYSCAMQYGAKAPGPARYYIGAAKVDAYGITLEPTHFRAIPQGSYTVVLERV